jgi:hypothetical protein
MQFLLSWNPWGREKRDKKMDSGARKASQLCLMVGFRVVHHRAQHELGNQSTFMHRCLRDK